MDDTSGWAGYPRGTTLHQRAGWAPGCRCEGARVVRSVVLDPFGGSGTVALVANRLGRRAILIELKPEYVAMGRRRVAGPLFAGGAE